MVVKWGFMERGYILRRQRTFKLWTNIANVRVDFFVVEDK